MSQIPWKERCDTLLCGKPSEIRINNGVRMITLCERCWKASSMERSITGLHQKPELRAQSK